MIELWFITPAFRRFELTALCLEQRRRLCDELGDHGIKASCVVVADDANAGTAARMGFHVARIANQHLGRKFAAGHLVALKRGATHTMPLGSDSWMHASAITQLPLRDDACAGTKRLATLRPDGRERLDSLIEYAAGFGVATAYPRAAIEAGGHYPCAPYIQRGCDSSTWSRTARAAGMAIELVEGDPLEYTDFKSYDVQTTDYRRLRHLARAMDVTAGDAAIDDLRRLYDGDLVDRLRELYDGRPPWEG